MKRTLLITGGACACLLVMMLAATWNLHGAAVTTAVTNDVPDPAPGYRVAIDPDDGGFTEPAPADHPEPAPLSYATDGLVVKDGPTGGQFVDLQGRFQSTFVMKVNEDGAIDIECETDRGEE